MGHTYTLKTNNKKTLIVWNLDLMEWSVFIWQPCEDLRRGPVMESIFCPKGKQEVKPYIGFKKDVNIENKIWRAFISLLPIIIDREVLRIRMETTEVNTVNQGSE